MNKYKSPVSGSSPRSFVTIKDVARVSGVSKSTVSEVLRNGHRSVSAETRKRVLEVAKELDYSPNALARGLVGKRMNTIGIVFVEWNAPQVYPFSLGVFLGVLAGNAKFEQNTLLFPLQNWPDGIERLGELCDGRCDGLLLMVPPEDISLPQALARRKVPCVLISSFDESGQVPSVDVDHLQATVDITSRLLEMGHRRIFCIQTTADGWPFYHARLRWKGYCQAMINAGIDDVNLAPLDLEGAVELALASSDAALAFVCEHDHLAIQLISALKQHGIRVPDDVSVVGFDDIAVDEPDVPALSTVRQPIHQLGERAAEILHSVIEGEITPGYRELLPTETILRESTAPATK